MTESDNTQRKMIDWLFGETLIGLVSSDNRNATVVHHIIITR
jgi:hypothetical protein